MVFPSAMLSSYLCSGLVALLLHCASAKIASEGRTFAVAFSAVRSEFTGGFAKLYINSRVTTQVNVTTSSGSDTYSVLPTSTTTVDVSLSLRTLEGVEDKGIIIQANDNITVTLSNARDDGVMETYLAMPVQSSLSYPVVTYPSSDNDITCVSGATCAFYSVIAFQDDTTVTISKPENGDYVEIITVNLNRFDVYTNRTQNFALIREYDFTGHYISSDKPISVTAGNPCADTDPNSLAAPVWASMPPIEQAGSQFVSHPLNTAISGYYYKVRVLALESDTDVTFTETGVSDRILFKGQFLQVQVFDDVADIVTCSKPCIVAQYSVNLNDLSAVFMTILPPTDHFVNDAMFTVTTSVIDIVPYINIILQTTTPESSRLLLDGNDLSGEDWTTSIQGGFSYLELELTGVKETRHTLVSENAAETFIALHHGRDTGGRGYGSIIGFGNFTDDELPVRDNPQYRISMTGDFRSGSGEDFTLECTAAYSRSMSNEASAMLLQANGLIGSQLCSGKSLNDISLISVSTPFVTNGNQGSTELRYLLKVDLNVLTQGEVQTCAAEIGVYLIDHDNWQNPILPTIPGCPAVIFNSRMFNESGQEWVCLNQAGQLTDTHISSELKYGVKQTGTFSTDDGSDLTLECLEVYNDVFDQKTFSQILIVQDRISSGLMCADTNVTLQTATTSLTSQNDQGLSQQNYVLDLGFTSTAPEVYRCADEVSAYMSPHSNWEQPILPQQPGCPALVFDPDVFSEDGQQWICP